MNAGLSRFQFTNFDLHQIGSSNLTSNHADAVTAAGTAAATVADANDNDGHDQGEFG